MIYIWTFSSVIIVSLVSLVGAVTLALNKKTLNRILFFLIAMATGALFGGAFFHLIPEGLHEIESDVWGPFAIVSGIVLFFVIEKFLHWHHCHTTDCHEDTPKTIAYMNLIGDGIHNFLDGIIIAISFMISWPVGVAASVAVILHEIPQEISDFGVLVYAGLKVKTALLFNLLSALVAILGAALALVIGSAVEGIIPYILLFAGGGFVYIAGSDLIPEIQKESSMKKSLVQLFGIMFGIGLMIALLFVGNVH